MKDVLVVLLTGLAHGGSEPGALPYLDKLAAIIQKECSVKVLHTFLTRHSHMPIKEQAQIVVNEINNDIHDGFGVIFVGHSMGGLVGVEAAKLSQDKYKVLGVIGLDTAFQGANIINNAVAINDWAKQLDEQKDPALDSALKCWPSVTSLILKYKGMSRDEAEQALIAAKNIKISDELQGPLGVMFEAEHGLSSDEPIHAKGVKDMIPGSDFLDNLFTNCSDLAFGAIRGDRTSVEDSWLSHMKGDLKNLKRVVPISGMLNSISQSFCSAGRIIGIDKDQMGILNSMLKAIDPKAINEKMRKDFIGCIEDEGSDTTLAEHEQELPQGVKLVDSTWTQSNPSFNHVHICASSDPSLVSDERQASEDESQTAYGNPYAINQLCSWIKQLKVAK